jgi:hypothetical protein
VIFRHRRAICWSALVLVVVAAVLAPLPRGIRGGQEREAALAATLKTAGRVVAFTAITVAAAPAALIVFRQRFLYSMGVGGMLCALIAADLAGLRRVRPRGG